MRVLIQVVKKASVTIDEKIYSSIDNGFLLFVGFNNEDNKEIVDKVLNKVLGLRIFLDECGKTNLSLKDVGGSILSVSQFTLYANCKKGKRPSFNEAARGEISKPLYDYFNEVIEKEGFNLKTGVFGADMKVELINDGPTTILIDSEDL